MADVTSLCAMGCPWPVAEEIAGGSVNADKLVALGVQANLATAIVDADGSGTEAQDLADLCALGVPFGLAQEIYDVLNP